MAARRIKVALSLVYDRVKELKWSAERSVGAAHEMYISRGALTSRTPARAKPRGDTAGEGSAAHSGDLVAGEIFWELHDCTTNHVRTDNILTGNRGSSLPRAAVPRDVHGRPSGCSPCVALIKPSRSGMLPAPPSYAHESHITCSRSPTHRRGATCLAQHR